LEIGILLVPYVAEIVTISVIITILVVYLIVLRKMGWLGGGNSGDLFRCPNQECKRVFQNPVEMKDLSETPVRVYPACPHCGNDLGPLLASRSESKSRSYKTPFRPRKPEAQTEDSAPRNETQQPKTVAQKENSQLNLPKTAENVKTQINSDKNKALLTVPQTPKSSLEAPREPEIVNKKPPMQAPNPPVTRETKVIFDVQVPKDRQAICSHYFGYLHTLQKAALIPNACYSCRRIMDCYCKGTDSGGTA
jgi:hypothetical protein